ncbi:MAG TPA: sulfite exporter TauE/SafE family protein [Chloroflexota bacterium]|nr:sulfite exporter TauE/SafE family protein [Chloroflexota bacterium]
MDPVLPWLMLFATAIFGGSLNAVAGGGTFLTFPSLVFAGILPKTANVTSTVALWPGTWASVAAYRRELAHHRPALVAVLASASLLGGLSGSLLLLSTPQITFVRLVPFLLLIATVLFACGRSLTSWLTRWTQVSDATSRRSLVGLWVAQFVMAIYGGYFGGGLGILMLAAFVAMGIDDIQEANALKSLLTACINGVAVIVFVLSGIVVWPHALVMLGGAVIGGYGAASIARRIDPRFVRAFVVAVGATMTLLFFFRA